MRLELDDLKLNDLLRIDNICELIEVLQKELSRNNSYLVVNRDDILQLINDLMRPQD